MGYLIGNLWLCMLIASILGVAVGWWMWGRSDRDEEAAGYQSAAPDIPPAPAEPIAAAAAADADSATTDDDSSPFLAAPVGDPDDLTRIKGVGPKLKALLNDLGVYHFSQIAGWNAEQVTEVDSHLANFKGRITRDRWIDQAHYLATGDIAGFEAEFGNIDRQI